MSAAGFLRLRSRSVRAWVGALAVGAVVVSGCSGGGSVAGGTSAGDGAAGSTFVLGQSAPINNLMPHGFQQSNMTWDRAIFDALVTYDGADVKPNLATKWDVSADGKTYTFALQAGVKFHDGKEFTGQIVADNIAWASDPANLVSGSAVLKSATVTVVSPTSVEMTFAEPVPQLLYLLAVVPMMDLTADMNAKPNGTGPFKVESFVANSVLDLARNDAYWNTSAAPKVESYEVRVFSDNASAQAALSSGQIQVLAFPPFNQLTALEKAGNKLVSKDAPGNFMIRVNTTAPPFNDKRVRQALSMAIDRPTFVKVGTADKSTPTCSVYPPGTKVYTEAADADCTYDLEGAKALLAEAGQSDLNFTVDASTVRQPEITAYLPILQEQLASIGVTMTINDITATLMSQNLQAGTYTTSVDWYPWANADPALLFISRTWTPGLTWQLFEDPAYAPMVLAAQAETDETKRAADYEELNEYLMDQSFVIPIGTRPYIYAVSPKAAGFDMDPLGMVVATSLSLSGS